MFIDPRLALQNDLLDSIPNDEYQRLVPNLQHVKFSSGQVIYQSSRPLEFAYFPTSSVSFLFYTTQTGSTAEIGVVGNEGVLGTVLVLGGNTMPYEVVAQIAGRAIAVPADLFRYEFSRGKCFQQVILRYTQALLTQVSQTAVCNRLHSIEQRLCRWLLLCHDRTHSDEIQVTQEFISRMLGGRREGVTVAAGHLQSAGIIRYSRGHICITDRVALEESACECYAVVRRECKRLLGSVQVVDRFRLLEA